MVPEITLDDASDNESESIQTSQTRLATFGNLKVPELRIKKKAKKRKNVSIKVNHGVTQNKAKRVFDKILFPETLQQPSLLLDNDIVTAEETNIRLIRGGSCIAFILLIIVSILSQQAWKVVSKKVIKVYPFYNEINLYGKPLSCRIRQSNNHSPNF